MCVCVCVQYFSLIQFVGNMWVSPKGQAIVTQPVFTIYVGPSGSSSHMQFKLRLTLTVWSAVFLPEVTMLFIAILDRNCDIVAQFYFILCYFILFLYISFLDFPVAVCVECFKLILNKNHLFSHINCHFRNMARPTVFKNPAL